MCQLDVQGDSFLKDVDRFLADENPPQDVQAYARGLIRDCWTRREELDATLRTIAEHWDPSRMSLVDRNVLRLGLCEMTHRPDVPPAVAINEAVELAKAFGSAESPGFVNGVLDAARKRQQSE